MRTDVQTTCTDVRLSTVPNYALFVKGVQLLCALWIVCMCVCV